MMQFFYFKWSLFQYFFKTLLGDTFGLFFFHLLFLLLFIYSTSVLESEMGYVTRLSS